MANVTVCLHRGTSLIGRLIRWQTRGIYSHASMIMHNGMVIEAREGEGVRVRGKVTPAKGEKVDYFRVALTDLQADKLFRFAWSQLNKPYDYTMVLRFVTRRQESRKTKGKWFCSELVYASFLHAGLPLLRATEPWEVSPQLLSRSPYLIPQ